MKKYVYLLLFVFVVTNSHAKEQKLEKFGHGTVVFPKQNLSMDVEIARTKVQRALGLMHRTYLTAESGMLFVFEQNGIQRIWMKSTLIPLDILFVSTQGRIVSMIKNLQPCRRAPCNIYGSIESAKYMLEVNAGIIDGKQIEIGQKLKILIP
ncbi:MAG: DUF192 domain-containing protein [Methylococcaceae bacterium]